MEYKKTKFIQERQKFKRIYLIVKTILISGGQGKFAQAIKKVNSNYKIIAPNKNEMNINNHLDNKLQYDFLLNSLRKQNRFATWMKASKSKNLEYVKEYFGYNNEKARSALNILNDEQIAYIKNKLNKGGKKRMMYYGNQMRCLKLV